MYLEKTINSLGKFISLMIPVMTILMIVIIVARYFFGIGLTGVQELVMYIHALIFLGCAGYVHFKDEHVRVDIFYRDSSNTYKKNINFFYHSRRIVESSIFLSFTSLLNFFYEGKNQLNKKIVKAGFTSLRKVKFFRDLFIKQAMGRINLTD